MAGAVYRLKVGIFFPAALVAGDDVVNLVGTWGAADDADVGSAQDPDAGSRPTRRHGGSSG